MMNLFENVKKMIKKFVTFYANCMADYYTIYPGMN